MCDIITADLFRTMKPLPRTVPSTCFAPRTIYPATKGQQNNNLIDPLLSPEISCLPLASFANRKTNTNPAEGSYGR
jgi:hypothetical protein